jgi:FlaA1/EpsC-like NDP-sugar epimerase
MEKMFIEANNKRNKFSVCRFGNVTHSHGSVLPFWLRLKLNNEPLRLTDSRMNRLMFSQEDAVDLIHVAIKETESGEGGFVLSKKIKTVNMMELAKVISSNVEEIGMRAGEKLDETLISVDELPYTHCDGDFIKITKEKNPLDGTSELLKEEYSSFTAKKMNVEEIIDMVEEPDSYFDGR